VLQIFDRWHGHGDGGVGRSSRPLRRDVDLHQISRFDPPLAGTLCTASSLTQIMMAPGKL